MTLIRFEYLRALIKQDVDHTRVNNDETAAV